MSEVVKSVSQKRYKEISRMVIIDSLDIVLNTIANQTCIENKDKSYTVKKLTNTVELILKLIHESNKDLFPLEIIETIKPKITTQLTNTFCYKQPLKSNNSKKELDDVPVIFTQHIQNAVEIPAKDVRSENVKLKKANEDYRYFALTVNIEGKEYVIIYAEENKYSKREIVEILFNNNIIDSSVITNELKSKYELL